MKPISNPEIENILDTFLIEIYFINIIKIFYRYTTNFIYKIYNTLSNIIFNLLIYLAKYYTYKKSQRINLYNNLHIHNCENEAYLSKLLLDETSYKNMIEPHLLASKNDFNIHIKPLLNFINIQKLIYSFIEIFLSNNYRSNNQQTNTQQNNTFFYTLLISIQSIILKSIRESDKQSNIYSDSDSDSDSDSNSEINLNNSNQNNSNQNNINSESKYDSRPIQFMRIIKKFMNVHTLLKEHSSSFLFDNFYINNYLFHVRIGYSPQNINSDIDKHLIAAINTEFKINIKKNHRIYIKNENIQELLSSYIALYYMISTILFDYSKYNSN